MDSEREPRRSRSASEDEPVADRFAFSAGSGSRKSTARKTTAKKSTAKSTAKKTTAKESTAKPAAKKTTAKKSTAKPAAKKTTAKPAAKKTTAKPPTTKKTTAKKPTAKAPAKSAAKAPSAKAPAAKKTTAKKATVKAPTAKAATAKAPARARTRAAAAAPAPPVAPPEAVQPVPPPVTEEVGPEAPTVVTPPPVEAPPTEEGEAPRFAAATRGRPAVPAPPAPPAREPVRAPAPARPEPTGPTPAAYRRRRTALAIVGLAVVGALVWAGVYFTSRDDEATPTPNGTVVTPTGSPTSPGPTVSPVASVAFPGEAVAEGGSLQVVPLGPRDEKCRTHTFGGTSAYLSDCTDWGNRADALYFFYVSVENTTDESLTLRRSGFQLTTATGTLRPVGVADGAADPTTFIAKSVGIEPQGTVSGYLVFETEAPFSPDDLTYEQGELSLTITFEGPENVRPRA